MSHSPNKLAPLFKQNSEVVDYLQQVVLDGIWYWRAATPDNKWVSPRFWEIIGYRNNYQQNDLSQLVHPEDAALWKKFQNGSSEINTIQEPIIRFLHKETKVIWMKCKRSLFQDGEHLDVIITFKDVTEFKEKEKLLLDTNRNAKIGAWEIMLDTNELYWSDITRSIHEVPPDFQPKLEEGINFYKEGYSRDTISRCVQEGLENGQPWNVELQIVTYTGKEVWVRAIGHIDFHQGKALRIYGSFQDIDEEKKIVEKLRQLSVLEAKNKEIEQFAYIVSHDLREPLTSMMGYLQLLQEEFSSNLSSDGQELLVAVNETANRMDILIRDLLDYSREGKEKDKQLVDTSILVQQVLSDLSLKIRETKATFEIDELPKLHAYPTELKSVFQNLISNALKFCKLDVPPVIKITAVKLKYGWQFNIADNGIGIPKGEEIKVFDIFQRLHREEYLGTGIGLASCKKIVEHHNGRIWVESKLGESSTFSFTILNS